MKRILLACLISFIGLSAIDAQTEMPAYLSWKQIICDIVPKATKPKPRSAILYPKVYQSEEYLSIQSDGANYCNAHITITGSQGETVKDDIIQVTADGYNLYYIGDLDGGAYEVKLETDDFVMTGNFMM